MNVNTPGTNWAIDQYLQDHIVSQIACDEYLYMKQMRVRQQMKKKTNSPKGYTG